MNRRVARIKAVQSLYQIEMTNVDPNEAIAYVIEEDEKRNTSFLEKLVHGTVKHLTEIDELIEDSLINWSLSRVGRVDRAILRMAVFEMKFLDDIPLNVTINEAIEIAKGFSSDEEAGRFVNGVLSNIAKKLPQVKE